MTTHSESEYEKEQFGGTKLAEQLITVSIISLSMTRMMNTFTTIISQILVV